MTLEIAYLGTATLTLVIDGIGFPKAFGLGRALFTFDAEQALEAARFLELGESVRV